MAQNTKDDTNALETAKPAKVFSLKGAQAVQSREDLGAKVTLRDELGEPLMVNDETGAAVPAFAVVVGKLSGTYRKAEQAVNDRTLKRRTTELTAELLEAQELEKLAKCVKSWNLTDDGRPIPATTQNVITVFQAAPWIRRELEAVMNDPGRFLA